MKQAYVRTMIPQEDLEKGSVYLIKSRNLVVGVYDGHRGFIGIREKFGDRYLFTEYLNTETFAGTVRPEKKIGEIDSRMPLQETFGTRCQTCGLTARWSGPPAPAPWICDGGCEDVMPKTVGNDVLFDLLDTYERRFAVN